MWVRGAECWWAGDLRAVRVLVLPAGDDNGGGDDGHGQQGSRNHDGLSAPPPAPWRGAVSTCSPYAASRCTDGQTSYCSYYFREVIDSPRC
jgi:hypothetical protein